jgi:hypothetical protein
MRPAKSRNWTVAEVEAAVAAIKAKPGLWDELERIEKTTADFRGTDIVRQEHAIIKKLYPDTTLSETTQLYGEIRKFRRAALNLK